MSILKKIRETIQKIIFGGTLVPQEFFLGLKEPQEEITVWLYGMGTPLDVTYRHSMACAAPFSVCIAFDKGTEPGNKDTRELSLKFCERNTQKRVLGEIYLKSTSIISVVGAELGLFEAQRSTNYCLPKIRLLAYYLLHSYIHSGKADTAGMKMSIREKRAAMVMFICPHPVSLASLSDGERGNIFPMNIMGDLGNGYFAFALRESRCVARLVERTGRIAVSSLPLRQASYAYQLSANHTKELIEWDQLPFATKVSGAFNIPIPVFAHRVREMEIKKIYPIGSHIFFVSKIIRDERYSNEPGLSVIHGFYQAWRLKGRPVELEASLAEDSFNKRGF